MLIKEINGIVKAQHSAGARSAEGFGSQSDACPVALHACERALNVVLFASAFADLANVIREIKKLHVHYVLECKSFIRFDLDAACGANLLPVAVLQTLSAQSYSHRHVNLERFDFFFDCLSDSFNLGLFFVFQLANDLVHRFLRILNNLFELCRVQLLEIIIEPAVVRIAPFFRGGPQIKVRFEVFDLLENVFVVGLVVASQALATIVHFGLLDTVV